MAFDVKILGVRWENGKYSLKKAVGWIGDAGTLMADPRFRDVSQMQSYIDYMGILTVEEALAMAKIHYDNMVASRTPEEQAERGGYSAYDTFQKSLSGVSFVLVHINEWESGL